MSDRQTIEVYNAQSAKYALLEPSDTPSETLATFIATLPKGGHVLDLGCGPGTSARHMARAGLNVTATDASEQMIALAAKIDGVAARLAVFDDLDEVDTYDGVWANFSLLHAPRADFPRHLLAIHKALKPGGLFHIAVKAGDGASRDTIGRHYTYYTEAALTDYLVKAGFSVGPYRRGRDKGLSGEDADWISTTAHA